MKRICFLLLFISSFYFVTSCLLEDKMRIPDDALRIRIIPNSNSSFDQNIKGKVKEKLEITMYDLLKDVKDSNEASTIISNNLDLVDKDVKKY